MKIAILHLAKSICLLSICLLSVVCRSDVVITKPLLSVVMPPSAATTDRESPQKRNLCLRSPPLCSLYSHRNSQTDSEGRLFKQTEEKKRDSSLSSPTTTSVDVCIVGAGLTGLSTAYFLKKFQNDHSVNLQNLLTADGRQKVSSVLVLEAADRIGGCLNSVKLKCLRGLLSADRSEASSPRSDSSAALRDGRSKSKEGEDTRGAVNYLCEVGANSFHCTPTVESLLSEIGLRDALLFADKRLERFIFFDGKLHPLPIKSLLKILQTHLLSVRGKCRLLLGLVGLTRGFGRRETRRRHRRSVVDEKDDVRGEMEEEEEQEEEKDESIAEVVERHFGGEVLDRLVSPFVSGVFAGDVFSLSCKAAFPRLYEIAGRSRGGILWQMICKRIRRKRGGKKGIASLKGGLIGLPHRMREVVEERQSTSVKEKPPSHQQTALTVETGWKVTRIWRSTENTHLERQRGFEERQRGRKETETNRWYCLAVNPDGRTRIFKSRVLVLTGHAHDSTARLLESFRLLGEAEGKEEDASVSAAKQAAALLRKIPYSNMGIVCISYPRRFVRISDTKAFGHLIPRSVGLKSLGSIWASEVFDNTADRRAPEEELLLTSFIGGSAPYGTGWKDERTKQTARVAEKKDGDEAGKESTKKKRNEWRFDPCAVSKDEMVKTVHEDLTKILIQPDTPFPLDSNRSATAASPPLPSSHPVLLVAKQWPQCIPQYIKGHLDIVEKIEKVFEETRNLNGLLIDGNWKRGVAVSERIEAGKRLAHTILLCF